MTKKTYATVTGKFSTQVAIASFFIGTLLFMLSQLFPQATINLFLLIGLTFLIFFLIQSISKINIHIFQYSMIGLALIMFYK